MFDGFIRDHAHLTPRATAVITPSRAVSYAGFNADIDRFGAALACPGVRAVAEFAVPNATGKVERNTLRDALIAALARSQG